MFIKLSDDREWRVRAQTQLAMGVVAQIVKKQLAPHLKTILPVWTRLLFDENKEVAQAAHNSLQVCQGSWTAYSNPMQLAIPPHKHVDALLFCKAELLHHFKECFVQTPQTLGMFT